MVLAVEAHSVREINAVDYHATHAVSITQSLRALHRSGHVERQCHVSTLCLTSLTCLMEHKV